MELWKMIASSVTVDDLRDFIERVKDIYSSLGIIAAVGLPYVETLFPFLPLFLMIAFNILSYGLVIGYLYTYIGTVLGTICIFVFMRYISTAEFKRKKKRGKNFETYLKWIEHTHPILHILVLMVPFSPTFMINYSMGLTKMRFTTFLLITVISRALLLIICVPLGMTLITLYQSGEFGGVEIMWLTVTGLVILGGTITGQIVNKKIKRA